METKEVLIIKFGEIALRGKNRYLFEKQLVDTIKKNIADCPSYIVTIEPGRYVIENTNGDFDFDLIVPKVSIIMGIVSCCPCLCTKEKSIESIQKLGLAHMKKHHANENSSFRVSTRRSEKSYPLNSQEISAEVGGYILENMPNLHVDVKNPEITLKIELRKYVYVYSKEIKGFGGLPVGCSDKAMALLSAGIDSPVACFLMAKRGVRVEAVYFHSPPYTSERALVKVQDLCQQLSAYTGSFKLNVVNFTEIQLKIAEVIPPEKVTIMVKRVMMKISEILAEQTDCTALITGDSVGQVASQTLKSMAAVEHGISMPVLRPLAGYDKNEIVALARQIGTYDISIRPFEDCCTLFVAEHPETKPKISIIESFEKNIENLQSLIESAVANIQEFIY